LAGASGGGIWKKVKPVGVGSGSLRGGAVRAKGGKSGFLTGAGVAWHQQGKAERDAGHARRQQEHRRRRRDPEIPEGRRQKHRGDVDDRERDGSGWCEIGGAAIFWK